jgi:hypothetical protein
MSGNVIVFTADQDNPERGEIKRFDNLELAERFVEALVAEGIPSETLKVFKIAEVPVVVTYRPVVSFAAPVVADESPEPAEAPERKAYERDGERLSTLMRRPEEV